MALRCFGVLLALACSIAPGCNGTSHPPPKVDEHPCAAVDAQECRELDGHSADAIAADYRARALLNLLLARYYAAKVSSQDKDLIDPLIRNLLARICGYANPPITIVGTHKRSVIESQSLDVIFPDKDLVTAVGAGCGFLEQSDGIRTYGSGVDWAR